MICYNSTISAHGINFFHQMALANAADRRVTAHLAQRFDVMRQQQGFGAARVIAVVAVAVGGVIFGWLYLRHRSIYAPWLAHGFADAVIFLIGYDLLAGSLK